MGCSLLGIITRQGFSLQDPRPQPATFPFTFFFLPNIFLPEFPLLHVRQLPSICVRGQEYLCSKRDTDFCLHSASGWLCCPLPGEGRLAVHCLQARNQSQRRELVELRMSCSFCSSILFLKYSSTLLHCHNDSSNELGLDPVLQ